MRRCRVYRLDGSVAVFDLSSVRLRLHGVEIRWCSAVWEPGGDSDWSPEFAIDLLCIENDRWACLCHRHGRPIPPPPGATRRVIPCGNFTCWEVNHADALAWCIENHQDFPARLIKTAPIDLIGEARRRRLDLRVRRKDFLCRQIESLVSEIETVWERGCDHWVRARKLLVGYRQEVDFLEGFINQESGVLSAVGTEQNSSPAPPPAPPDASGEQHAAPAAPVEAEAETVADPKPNDARITPGSRALAAALDMRKEGIPVTLKGACKRAGVDRGHVRKRYSDAAKAIRMLGRPDRPVPRGTRDRRTGAIDGVDDDD